MNSDFYLRLLLSALVIIGIWTACGKGMILDPLATWLEERLPEWACKPLFACPPCMSSVHGAWIWAATGGSWTWFPMYVLSLCGLMKLLAHNLLRNG